MVNNEAEQGFWQKAREWLNVASPAAAFVAGILGGALYWVLLRIYEGFRAEPFPGRPPDGADVIAIANTYIVFTTLIFVAVTVLMAFLALYFGWKFATDQARIHQETRDALLQKLRNDPQFGVDLIDAALKNVNVIQHLEDKVGSTIREYGKDRADRMSADADAIRAAFRVNEGTNGSPK